MLGPDPTPMPPTLPPASPPPAARPPRARRWIALAIAAVIIGWALYNAIEPYDERGYVAIPHGDHVHWVPRDRDPNVPIGQFPTVEPAPDQRLMPDGTVVPIER